MFYYFDVSRLEICSPLIELPIPSVRPRPSAQGFSELFGPIWPIPGHSPRAAEVCPVHYSAEASDISRVWEGGWGTLRSLLHCFYDSFFRALHLRGGEGRPNKRLGRLLGRSGGMGS